jgi:endogenous inhibitor of DNA gyrase (YacG/DUF329 family)
MPRQKLHVFVGSIFNDIEQICSLIICYTKGESHVKCPSCNKTIGWLQQSRFGKGFCSRQAAECPHCSVNIVWAKWPHILIQCGVSCLLLGFWSELLFPIKILDGFDLYFWCSILGLPLLILGIFRKKFDVVGENKE